MTNTMITDRLTKGSRKKKEFFSLGLCPKSVTPPPPLLGTFKTQNVTFK